MVQPVPAGYLFDPADPRAPSREQWAQMSPAERDRVVDMLPSEFSASEVDFLPPPEGDPHWNASTGARQTLDGFFRRIGRKIYISGNMAVYYPNERFFSPDVIAVLDVETRERNSWVVTKEGKGLDFALEVHVAGERQKDERANVERYARLGIHEYVVFDRGRLKIAAYRRPRGGGVYQRLVPQAGRISSEVLGLDLAIEGSRIRFFVGNAPLEDAGEMIGRLGAMIDESIARQEEAERLATELAAKLEEAERQLAEARAEIERLKGR
jgi:Uma2 family endonuclease